MAYSIVAHTISGTDSTGTTSAAINTSGASLLVVATAFYVAATEPTLTDSYSNTWTPATKWVPTGSNLVDQRFWYCAAPTVGAGHTFTISGSGSFASLAVVALSGSTPSPFDTENGSGGTLQTGSVTPSVDNEILIAMAVSSTVGAIANAIDSSFTVLDTLPLSNFNYWGIATAYLIETTAATKNPTWSGDSGGAYGSAIITFKAAAGGGGGTPVGADAMHYYREHVMRGAA